MAARRRSRQRELIIEFLKSRKDHPTADIVYNNVRMKQPSISLGTVYRNLTLLADAGEILRFRIGDGADRFDGNISPHFHFVCRKCGRIMDLETDRETDRMINRMEETIKETADRASANFEGQITGHITYFYGNCRLCQKPEISEGAGK